LDSSNGPGRKRGPRNGVISEINGQRRGPVLLFGEIPGFRKGFRIVTGSILNAKRLG
jgi:hypothetical protein